MTNLFQYSKTQSLIAATAEYYQITPEQLLQKPKSKHMKNIRPRQICQKLMYDYVRLSQEEIATVFKCERSTVSSNIKALNEIKDDNIRFALDSISRRVFDVPALIKHPIIEKIENKKKIMVDKQLNEALNRVDGILSQYNCALAIRPLKKKQR